MSDVVATPPLTPAPTPPAAYRALLAATHGILREVVELHGPQPWDVYTDGHVPSWECKGCDAPAYWEYPHWPCSTTDLIAERLGVRLREDAYVVDGETGAAQ